MRTESFKGALLSTLVIASLITPLVLLSPSPVHAALTPHDPIYTEGDNNFTILRGNQEIEIVKVNRESFSLLSLIQPLDVEKNEVVTLEGYVGGRVTPPYYVFYYGWAKYLNLHDAPEVEVGSVVRIEGKVTKLEEWGGDISVTDIETIAPMSDVAKSIEVVDNHWSQLSSILMEEYNLPENTYYTDGAGGDPLWDQEKDELILWRNIGWMAPYTWHGIHDWSYEPVIDVYYFVNTKQEIMKVIIASPPSPRRWPLIAGIVGIIVIIGVVAALYMRRRKPREFSFGS